MLMLEPRRLATRAAARWMAATLGEAVGETIGFRVRGETRVSRATRVEVVTEGVLTRLLLSDPTLDGVGLLIFDEFHERSVHADLGLALSLQSQELLRPDLRVLVMSATLDGASVAALLGNAPVVSSAGRAFPVEIRYLTPRSAQRVEAGVAAAVRRALATEEGSILAFLPGAAEIGRAVELLRSVPLPADVSLHPLFGDLPAAAQDAAIAPAPIGRRKVVLATSIAETSLTIDGIRVVVDGGLTRTPKFSPRSGMARLETVRVSRASADQRCGRAGRTAAGICYRTWAEGEQASLLERSTPEILDVDLAPLALDLASAGILDPSSLRWLDPPPAPSLAHARELLSGLEAVDAAGRITSHGRAMSAFGLHPRFAHMLLRAREAGRGATACAIAALLEDRDVLRRDAMFRDPDLWSRVQLLSAAVPERSSAVDRDALRRARERSRAWRTQLRVSETEALDEHACGWLLALAYPDRVAQRRDGTSERYLLRNGRGARLDDPGTLAGAPYLVIAELDGRVPESRVFLAARVERADVERSFDKQIVREELVEWDASAGCVVSHAEERLGAIVLRDTPLTVVDDDVVARVLLAAIMRGDGVALRWSDAARQLRARVGFLRRLDPTWPDWSDAALDATCDSWLRPHLLGLRRRSEVEQLELGDILMKHLGWEQRRALDRLAPTHLVVPSGSRVTIDYADPASPALAVRLQEMFGLADTPLIGDGCVALTLHLLSPARRPVQVTRDLAGFWRSSYFDVRKELRGRYPKHEWPDDPLRALPTRRTKRRQR
jgi:ATP-dependent helicase HrpB